MTPALIRVESACPEFSERAWESASPVRIGRADTLELVLDHPAISRHHAEIAFDQRGWTAAISAAPMAPFSTAFGSGKQNGAWDLTTF